MQHKYESSKWRTQNIVEHNIVPLFDMDSSPAYRVRLLGVQEGDEPENWGVVQ